MLMAQNYWLQAQEYQIIGVVQGVASLVLRATRKTVTLVSAIFKGKIFPTHLPLDSQQGRYVSCIVLSTV